MKPVDEAILYALADWRIPLLEKIFTDITSLGSMTVITLVTATAFALLWIIPRNKAGAARMVTAAGGAEILLEIIKLLVARPRPTIIPHLVASTGYSFPSGHALVAVAAYSTLSALVCRYVADRKARSTIWFVCWTVAVLVSFSRVYLGVHYLSDVVAGFLIGIAWAYCAERLCRSAGNHRDTKAQRH